MCLVHTSVLLAQVTFPVNGPHDQRDFPTFLVNATVQVDASSILYNATLKIEKGKIVACSETLVPPAGSRIIDCVGKFIYPSFIDLYSNYGLPEVPNKQNPHSPQYERTENKPTAWNDALHPEHRAALQFEPSEKESGAILKAGFGVVLTHTPDGIARGTGALVALGQGMANKRLLKSDAAAFYSFKKGSSTQKYPSSLMGAIALLRQTEYDARWYKSRDNAEERNVGLEAWNQNSGLPQIFEVTEKNDIPRVHTIGAEFEKKFIVKTIGDEYQRIDELSRIGYPLVVPLNFPKAYDVSDPYLSRKVSLQELLHWEAAPANAARLEDKRIAFCLTASGCDKDGEFLKNLRKAVKHGLTTTTAIHALTVYPAELLGMSAELGSLEAGKWANFIIVDGDLFDSNTKIEENWVMGERHKLIDGSVVDVRGTYNLNLDNHFYTIQVAGESAHKVSAKLVKINEKDTTSIKVNFSVQDQLVSLAFNPKDEYYSQQVRLAGNIHKESRIWEGKAQMPDGSWQAWTAIRQKGTEPKSAKRDSSLIKPTTVGTVRYPNRAFGLDSLPETETVWFKNATVWTSGDLGILEKGEVLIHDGKILAVGKRLNPEEILPRKHKNVIEIDLKGKHLTPGIVDEHSHIAISRGVNEGTQASSAEVRIGDAINPDDINIFRNLSGGVTTIQQLHGSANPIGGQSSIIKLRWGETAKGMRFEGAPGFIKFALGENVKQSNWGDRETVRYPQTRMGVEQVFYDHFIRAKEYDQKWQLLAGEAVTRPFWKTLFKREKADTASARVDLELQAIAEILNGKRHISCHSYVQSEINMLMHVADSLGFKVNTFTHVLEGYKVADKMRAHGAAASTFSDWWAYKHEVADAIPYNAALMHKQGLLVAINSDDAEMARRLNQEAAKAIKYGGVAEEEALKMVTINPAKMLHIDHRVGSISPGKDADLVVWSDHPLSVYAKVEKTFVDGRKYFDRDSLSGIKKRDAADRARIMHKMLSESEKSDDKNAAPNPNDKEYHCDDVDEEI